MRRTGTETTTAIGEGDPMNFGGKSAFWGMAWFWTHTTKKTNVSMDHENLRKGRILLAMNHLTWISLGISHQVYEFELMSWGHKMQPNGRDFNGNDAVKFRVLWLPFFFFAETELVVILSGGKLWYCVDLSRCSYLQSWAKTYRAKHRTSYKV